MNSTGNKNITKASQVEQARDRLERAIDRLENALETRQVDDNISNNDEMETLRAENLNLLDLNRKASRRLDDTIGRLKAALDS